MKKFVVILIAFILILQGCSSAKDKDDSQASSTDITTAATATPSVTAAATDTPVPATATPLPPQLVLPITTNDTGKVLIQTVSTSTTYRTNSFLITSVNGESVVVDPTSIPAKAVVDLNPAAIVSTHNHSDHTDANFVKEYPDAQTLFFTDGELQTKDFHIYSIKASHNDDNINGSDYIMVFEVDGLRIAHMGDIGQNTLTEDQLAALGEIDIAFMQFENSYSSMTLDNMKGFNLIEQVNPKIIIPTHYGYKTLDKFKEKYGKTTEIENILEISKEDLPDTALNVYMMSNDHKYK
ncbi:MAG TPA: MBL fold metallo-hydrolase [Mobilitalea sp.]|nr:MBL fold metallo-hydrolase [Mobilitalea sp.]